MKSDDPLRTHLLAHLEWSPIGDVDRLRFLALALAGESGELANVIKKSWRDGDDRPEFRRQQIIDEVADVANYTHMIAMHLGIDLHAEMLRKLRAVEQRSEWMDGRAS
jgi:NTP pyrophosphatase (non-canonical NTP hydrolase)